MADFYQMQAEVLATLRASPMAKPSKRKPATAPASTRYLVYAVNRRYAEWYRPSRIVGDLFTIEAAEQAARNLSDIWEHRTIVKIDLPEISDERPATTD